MSFPSRWWLAALAPIAVVVFALTPVSAHGKSESPAPRNDEVRTPPADVSMAMLEVEAREVGDYLVWRSDNDHLLAVLDANARFLASLYYVPPPPAPVVVVAPRVVAPTPVRPAPASQPTGACGGATNGADQYIGRESGGNPGIYNAGGSGAYGCYQIMPGTWAASCGDLGAEVGSSGTQQAECASRLPLSAWGG